MATASQDTFFLLGTLLLQNYQADMLVTFHIFFYEMWEEFWAPKLNVVIC